MLLLTRTFGFPWQTVGAGVVAFLPVAYCSTPFVVTVLLLRDGRFLLSSRPAATLSLYRRERQGGKRMEKMIETQSRWQQVVHPSHINVHVYVYDKRKPNRK